MRVLIFIFMVFTFSLSACKSSTEVIQPSATPVIKAKPNIVVILADDMRWDLMSNANHPQLVTPTLDKLANEGVSFQNAFVPVAVCSPSRAALLTGREVHQASAPGIYWRNNSFLETQTIFPQILQNNGYRTGYFGKWHLGDGKTPKAGFDQWESFDWLGKFRDTSLWVNGTEQQFRGFADDIIASRAAKFIRQQAGTSTPFFTFVGLKQPHLPFASPIRHRSAFSYTDIPRPDTFYEDAAAIGKEVFPGLKITNENIGIPLFGSWENFIKSHYRGVLGLDDAVSEIIKALEETGELDNTLFVYTSDNGYSLGDHGLTEKHLTYEEPLRVPLLIRYPKGVQAGKQRKELVTNIDLAPTLLDFAGIAAPAYMTGSSWRPLLESTDENNSSAWREQLFFWLHAYQAAVRTADFKLIESFRTPGHYELYDLKADPKEVNNLYDRPEYQEIQADMHKRLISEKEKTGWTERTQRSIRRAYTSQVMDSALATRLVKQLSAENLQPEMTLPTLEGRINWNLTTAQGTNFVVPDVSGTTTSKSMLMAIPLKRSTSWDPFVILRFGNKHKTYLYSRGKEIWYSAADVPINIANPPIHTGLDYAYLRIDLSSDPGEHVNMLLEAPLKTVEFPLEN